MKYMPVERKVYAGTIGAGVGFTVSEFVLWGVDQIWWPDPSMDIPTPVAGFVGLVVTTGLAFLAGWLAKQGVEVPEYEAEDAYEPEESLPPVV